MFKTKKAFLALTQPSFHSEGRRMIHSMKVSDFKVNTHTVVNRMMYWMLNPYVDLSADQFKRDTQVDKVVLNLSEVFEDLAGNLASNIDVPEDVVDITDVRLGVTVERAQEFVDVLSGVLVENAAIKRRVDRYLADIVKAFSAPTPTYTRMLNVFRVLVAIWELLMLATAQGDEMWNTDLMNLYHDVILPAWVFDFADEKTVSDSYIVISTPVGYNTERNAVDETAALLASTGSDGPAASFDLNCCIETSKPRMTGVLAVKTHTSYFHVQRVEKEAITSRCIKKVANAKCLPNVMLR
eukprot:scpid81805/ scgid12221/ 